MFSQGMTMEPALPNAKTHVIFFAAVPPKEIAKRMAESWRAGGSGERFRSSTLHASIQLIGKTHTLDKRLVERAGLAASALKTAAFEICLDRLMTIGGKAGNRALVLGTDGRNERANDLAAELHHLLREVGFILPRRKTLVPHVTLAYGAGFAESRHLAEPIRWTIREITLIDSLQGQGRHVPLGTWPLHAV